MLLNVKNPAKLLKITHQKNEIKSLMTSQKTLLLNYKTRVNPVTFSNLTVLKS